MAEIHSIAMITRTASHVSLHITTPSLKESWWKKCRGERSTLTDGSASESEWSDGHRERKLEKREQMYYLMPSVCLGGSPVLIDLLFAGMPLPPYCSNLIMLLTDVADTVSPFWIRIV